MRLRSLLLTLALFALVAPCAALADPVARGTGGAAASVDRDATQTAIDVLRKGGNAIDAAVAANATLGVTEPYVAGIGGGGFLTIYLARRHRVITLDGRETAPAGFPQDAFIDPATGKPYPFTPERVTSGMAVGVPGTLSTWQTALRRYGTISLARALRPAIRVAKHGFTVDATFQKQTNDNRARLEAFTPSRGLFLPGGMAPAVGSTFKNPDLARTYRLIARRGIGAFYGGSIGLDVAHTVRNPPLAPDAHLGFPVRPGLMTVTDLASYRTIKRKPTSVGYRGLQVDGMPPPSSGGSTVGEALNILEGFKLSGPDRVKALHRYLEASRLSFADRNRWVGDPAYSNVPLDGLLSDGFAGERRCLIGDRALASPVAPGDPNPPYSSGCPAGHAGVASQPEGTSTNHLTVVDRQGNVVSWTSTIEQIAGSAIAVPNRGFLLNNELTDFDAVPPANGQPDPNLPAGGKRPRSSMAPTIVLRDGRPILALGSPGGATIITTVLQILVNRFDFGMALPQAIAAPRASQRDAAKTDAEPAFIDSYGSALSSRFGQAFAPVAEIGAATAVQIGKDGHLLAAAEPVRRGTGSAAVVCPDGQTCKLHRRGRRPHR